MPWEKHVCLNYSFYKQSNNKTYRINIAPIKY